MNEKGTCKKAISATGQHFESVWGDQIWGGVDGILFDNMGGGGDGDGDGGGGGWDGDGDGDGD